MTRHWLTVTIAASLIVGLGAAAGIVAASHGGTKEDPWSRDGGVIVATTDVLSPQEPCNEDSGIDTGNGVFGDVYALPDGADEHRFRLTMSATLGVDAVFFEETSDGCEELEVFLAPLLIPLNEFSVSGEVPDGATHVVIDYWQGSGSYTLEVPDPDPACEVTPFC